MNKIGIMKIFKRQYFQMCPKLIENTTLIYTHSNVNKFSENFIDFINISDIFA